MLQGDSLELPREYDCSPPLSGINQTLSDKLENANYYEIRAAQRSFSHSGRSKNGARGKRWKEGGGGGERRERLPANPSILENPFAHEPREFRFPGFRVA